MSSSTTLVWDGTSKGCGIFVSTQVGFTGISGGDTWVVQGCIDNINFKNLSGTNLTTNAAATTISADGLYSFPASGYVRLVKTGSVSTPTINLLFKR